MGHTFGYEGQNNWITNIDKYWNKNVDNWNEFLICSGNITKSGQILESRMLSKVPGNDFAILRDRLVVQFCSLTEPILDFMYQIEYDEMAK